VSSPERNDAVAADFSRDVDTDTWLPRLAGVDAVINAVGVLRDSRRRPIVAVHDTVPRALFEACAQAGVRRVVQVSALGIAGCHVPYARSKIAAENALLAHVDMGRLDGVVVRPSIIFGRDAPGSELFFALARLPVLLLPRAVRRAQCAARACSPWRSTNWAKRWQSSSRRRRKGRPC
jgi:nucleoside-diphosphate-sugar epimerase